MLIGDRWVFFAFILNWRSLRRRNPNTVAEFAGAVSWAMQIVKEKLRP